MKTPVFSSILVYSALATYRAMTAGPTPLGPTPSEHIRPDLIWTRFGPEIALFGSKSDPNQVGADVFGGGRAQRGRSGCHGPVGPPEVLTLADLDHPLWKTPLWKTPFGKPLGLKRNRRHHHGMHENQDHGKGGLSLRRVAFMAVLTVLAVLAVLEITLPSFCLSYKIQRNEATAAVLTVLAVSAVMAVSIMTAPPLKLNPPFPCS